MESIPPELRAYEAARKGNIWGVLSAIQDGATNFNMIAYEAMKNGYVTIVEDLVDTHRITPTYAAVLALEYNHIRFTMRMMERGIDVDTIFDTAARYNRLEVLQYMIYHGLISKMDINDAAIEAARHGHTSTVSYLVEAGADNFNRMIEAAMSHGHLILSHRIENMKKHISHI